MLFTDILFLVQLGHCMWRIIWTGKLLSEPLSASALIPLLAWTKIERIADGAKLHETLSLRLCLSLFSSQPPSQSSPAAVLAIAAEPIESMELMSFQSTPLEWVTFALLPPTCLWSLWMNLAHPPVKSTGRVSDLKMIFLLCQLQIDS